MRPKNHEGSDGRFLRNRDSSPGLISTSDFSASVENIIQRNTNRTRNRFHKVCAVKKSTVGYILIFE